jgi:hypothetical protein
MERHMCAALNQALRVMSGAIRSIMTVMDKWMRTFLPLERSAL